MFFYGSVLFEKTEYWYACGKIFSEGKYSGQMSPLKNNGDEAGNTKVSRTVISCL